MVRYSGNWKLITMIPQTASDHHTKKTFMPCMAESVFKFTHLGRGDLQLRNWSISPQAYVGNILIVD